MTRISRGLLVVWFLLVAGMPFGWAYETIPIASDPFGIATAPIHPPVYPPESPVPLRTMTLSGDPWEIFQTGRPVNLITLDPGRYPSQQGWSLNGLGPESRVFTPGPVMRINSMGIGSAWSFMQRPDFNPALPSVMVVRALVSREEGYSWDHWGLNFGISANLMQASVGLGPNHTIDDYGNLLDSGSNTSYRTFRIEFLPGHGARLRVNGGAPVAIRVAPLPPGFTRIFFGDGTSGANADSLVASFEFFQLEPGVEILSLAAIPGTLWIDKTGAGSGIAFRAVTNEPAQVSFTARKGGTGPVINLGSAGTVEKNGEHIAVLDWYGSGLSTEGGSYELTATIPGDSETGSFEVVQVLSEMIGFHGTWSRDNKDPAVNTPPEPAAETCPLLTWDALAGKNPGYFAGLIIGDPVNAFAGTFLQPEVDVRLRARHGLTLARVYNSLDTNLGPFGRGWSSPFFARLTFEGSAAILTNSDGSRVVFTDVNGTYAAPEGCPLRLMPEQGRWLIVHPGRDRWLFDGQGRILAMEKCCKGTSGFTVDFAYDGAGHLDRVTNTAGQWLDVTCDPSGRITGVTDSTGRSVGYAYSSEGLLIRFTDPMGRETVYEYGDDGFMTSVIKPGNRRTEITYHEKRVASLRAPEGGLTTFSRNADNTLLEVTDPGGVLRRYRFSADGKIDAYEVPSLGITTGFQYTGAAITGHDNSLGDRKRFAYGAEGDLNGRTDETGFTTTYDYHPVFRKLTRKTDGLGRTWEYTYSAESYLTTTKDPAAGVTTHFYNSFGNRVTTTDPLGRVTRYLYSADGAFLTGMVDAAGGVSSFTYCPRGNMLTSTDPLGRTTTFQYDLLDRLVKTIYPDGRFVELVYDEAGNVAIRRDNLGRETQHAYDLGDRLLTTTRPDGSVVTAAYDAAGRKVSETDALGRITRFELDGLGRMTKIIYPDNTFETMSYDTEGRLIARTDELGRTTRFEHDAMGRILATIDPTGARWESVYDQAGRKISDKDTLGRTTAYVLDVLDRVTRVIYPEGAAKDNTFDSVGNLLTSTDALGHAWNWVYDSLNRQVKAIRPDGASSTTEFDAAGQVVSETDVMGRKARYAHDLGGRRTATIDPLGNLWANSYDSAGRLVSVVDPLGNAMQTAYDVMDRVVSETDALGRTTQYEHDAAGRRIARTDAMGRRSLTSYDLRDRVTAQVDPEGRTVHFGHDAAGQRVSLTDGANRVWRWAFDAAGRVISETDPLGNVVQSGYDLVGNRVSRTNARGELTAFSFDLRNRLTQVTYPDGTVATMAYDLEGRELVRSWAGGVIRKTWDSVGNLLSEVTDPWGKGWQYCWDPAGNRVGAVDPDGGRFAYRFDALNRLVELDAPGNKDDMRISYDAAGRMVLEDRASSESEYRYDAAGQLLELKHFQDKGGKRKLVASRRYSHDQAGNRVAVEDEDGDESRFSFNGSDWLTRAAYPGGKVVSYGYNGAGDRLEEVTATPVWQGHGRNRTLATQTETLVYQYDAAGRMVARGADLFQFDQDGNQVSAVENGKETRYLWSSDNRLVRAERTLSCGHQHGKCHCTPKVTYEAYSYAPEDWKRLTRTVGLEGKHGEEERTYISIFDQADESHEYELKLSQGHDYKHGKCHPPKDKIRLDLLREFVGGPGTDDLVASKYRGHDVGLLKDALGSTIALTNAGGNPVARIDYDAWGNIEAKEKDPDHHKKPCVDDDEDDYLDRFFGGRSFENPEPWRFGAHFGLKVNPYLFAGRRFEPFTLTYNNRWRSYNPRLGRFSSRDPLGHDADINLYRYARGNALRYTDPMGLWSRDNSGLPVFSQGEKWSTWQIENGLRDRGFAVDSVMSAILGGIYFGGNLGDRLRDLIQMRLMTNKRFTFSGFDQGGSKFITVNANGPHRLYIDSDYIGDEILLVADVFHEFVEDWLDDHSRADGLEAPFFKTLFRSSWSRWMPQSVTDEVLYEFSNPDAKAAVDCLWRQYGIPRKLGGLGDLPGFYQDLRQLNGY